MASKGSLIRYSNLLIIDDRGTVTGDVRKCNVGELRAVRCGYIDK